MDGSLCCAAGAIWRPPPALEGGHSPAGQSERSALAVAHSVQYFRHCAAESHLRGCVRTRRVRKLFCRRLRLRRCRFITTTTMKQTHWRHNRRLEKPATTFEKLQRRAEKRHNHKRMISSNPNDLAQRKPPMHESSSTLLFRSLYFHPVIFNLINISKQAGY